MTQAQNYSQLYKKADTWSIFASALLILSLISIYFFTYWEYTAYIEKTEETKSLQSRLEWLKKELTDLNDKKSKVKSDSNTQKLLAQFAWNFREDAILNQVYEPKDWIVVHNISMDKWQKLPNWLNLANINISIDAKTIWDIYKYLEYLTDEKSKIRFVIKSATLPVNTDTIDSVLNVSISLGMYYYEK